MPSFTSIHSPAIRGSKAATIVVLTPCPRVFHFMFSESTVLPSSSINPRMASVSCSCLDHLKLDVPKLLKSSFA